MLEHCGQRQSQHAAAEMVAADFEAIIGLAGQELFHRIRKPKGASRHDQLLRRRESNVWGQVVNQVGPPPDKVRDAHVFDRGADSSEVFVHLTLAFADYVIRAAKLKRIVRDEQGAKTTLSAFLTATPCAGAYALAVRAIKQQAARMATLARRATLVTQLGA